MNYKSLLRAISLLALMVSLVPASSVGAQPSHTALPADFFQLPWDQGVAWVAIDGIDNGTKRPLSSSHHFSVGGAIDFAPHNNMVKGEDTSNYWAAAAAAGTVVEISNCHIKIAHENGWLTEYQFLAKIQVKLGDSVSRNQRLGIIADGVRQKFCPGSAEPNVPHLHFILRPTLIGASLAGWVINYLPVLNKTTFTKHGQALGLFKPLLNVFDSTPTPTAEQTATTVPGSETPSATLSPTLTSSFLTLSKTANPQTYGQAGQVISYNFTITNTGATHLGPAQFVINDNKLGASLPCGPANVVLATNQTLTCTLSYTITQADMSAASLTNIATASGAGQTSAPVSVTITNLVIPTPTPTLFGQYVSTTVNPQTINLGETTEVTVNLNNVPSEGYRSAEFTCFYEPSFVEVSSITATDLFGNDAVMAINESHFNRFIVAIAGSNGNKANTSGVAFTFNVKGLQIVQTQLGCEARVSKGDNELTQLPSASTHLTIIGNATSTPTPNLTPNTPTVLPSTCDRAEFVAHVNTPPGTVMSPGTTFVKTWRLKNVGSCTWSQSYQLVFFYGEQMGAFSSAALPVNVSTGQTVDISINMTAPNAPGSYHGYWMFMNTNGAFFGIGPDANQPWFVDITVAGPTLPPSATFTRPPPSATPTILPTACDKAQMIADINIPDGTVMLPGQTFTKTWRLKNIGTCTWTTTYQLVFFSGEQMGSASSANFTQNVLVGQTVDISVNLAAPNTPGSYRGYWIFKNASGALFGIGTQANKPWWVDIRVSGSTNTPGPILTQLSDSPTPSATLSASTESPISSITPGGPTVTPVPDVTFDFVANVCSATWTSGAGQLPCPGIDGDAKGFVLRMPNPKLETGATDTRAGLLTVPQNIQNGYIQGRYPPFRVQSGDRFRSIVNCEGGATNCYVAFRLDYEIGNEPVRTFWGPFLERYDGHYYLVDVDLSPLAGKDVKFILSALAAGISTGDRALWVGPYIYRPSSTVTTATPTIAPNTYQNTKYEFKFTLPSGSTIVSQSDNTGRVDLPLVASGTNLLEKYVQVNVVEFANPCVSPAVDGNFTSSENVTVNNIQFLKQTGQGAAAGNLYDWVTYSTVRNNACISLAFILHSANRGNFPTPPPLFDKVTESAVFEQIMSTFTWLATSTSTPTGTIVSAESETPTVTSTSGTFETPALSPTLTVTPSLSPTPFGNNGAVAGQILVSKPVIVNVYDASNILVATMETTPDGGFRLEVPAGTYTVVALVPGFLRAQGTVTLPAGNTTTVPTISLLAGDINGNDVIDQFDALSIGMNYNYIFPEVADLNNDRIINVLDLELLAKNYRKTGPVVWE